MDFGANRGSSSKFGVALLIAPLARATVSHSKTNASTIIVMGTRTSSSQTYNAGLSAGPKIAAMTDTILDRNAKALHRESLKYRWSATKPDRIRQIAVGPISLRFLMTPTYFSRSGMGCKASQFRNLPECRLVDGLDFESAVVDGFFESN
jgi:hypothetical protein